MIDSSQPNVPTASLVSLAETRQLPEFQYMDQATLRWIIAGEPAFEDESASTLTPPAVAAAFLGECSPLHDWYADARIVDSLHGARHGQRSALYAGILAADESRNERQALLAMVAGSLHDIRRLNDNADPEHGVRSGQWINQNSAAISAAFNLDLTAYEWSQVSTAVELHETPYDNFTPTQTAAYESCRTLADVVKTADALDRYRLPKLKWWIDPAQLRLQPSAKLKKLAFSLIVTSEKLFLDGTSSPSSVYKAAMQEHLL